MSTAKFDTLSNLAGTQSVPVATVAQGSAKAWVNFNGTGTVAIRAAFNVTSITDNGTGAYIINFATAMPDTNYAVLGTSGPGGYNGGQVVAQLSDADRGTNTTSATQIRTSVDGSGTGSGAFDSSYVNVAIFR